MRSITKHSYTIIVRAAYDNEATDPDATTYDFIIGSENRFLEYDRVEWTPNNIPKGIDSIITRMEDGVGGGCIWDSDVMVVDNDNPHIKKEFEKYGGLKGYFELCCYKKEATRVLKTYPIPPFSTAVVTASQLIDKKHCLNLLKRNKTERDELKQKRVGPNSLFMHQNESIVDWETRLKFMFPEETKEIEDIKERIKTLGSKSKITTPKSNHDDYDGDNKKIKKTEIEKAREYFYPCAIISDGYSGVYSGGKWTAWCCGVSNIPDGIFDDDVTCAETWSELKRKRTNHEILFGVGDTPDEALLDMYKHAVVDERIFYKKEMFKHPSDSEEYKAAKKKVDELKKEINRLFSENDDMIINFKEER